jgi:hypothetical protein
MRFIVALLLLLGLLLLAPGAYGRSGHRDPTSRPDALRALQGGGPQGLPLCRDRRRVEILGHDAPVVDAGRLI